MIRPAGQRPADRRAWGPVIAAGAVYAISIAVVVWLRAESTTDFRDFWRTGRHFLRTGQLTTELGVHNYLPFFPLFMLPFARLPLHAAIELFTLISLASLVAGAALADVLRAGVLPARPHRLVIVPLLLVLPYATSCLVLGSVSLLLLVLIVATGVLVTLRRDAAAGFSLALAIVIKLMPAALVAPLTLLQRWRTVIIALLWTVVLGAAMPLALLGPRQALRQHAGFYRTALLGHSAIRTLTAERPPKANFSNNALPMVLRRLLSPLDARKGRNDPPVRVNIAVLPPAARIATYVALLAWVIAASAVHTLRRGRGVVGPDAPPPGPLVLEALAVWSCVMLLASPLVWTHYLPLAYPALVVLAQRATGAGSRRAWAARAALGVWVAGILALPFPHARAAGAQIFSVLALWLALVHQTGRAASRPRLRRPSLVSLCE